MPAHFAGRFSLYHVFCVPYEHIRIHTAESIVPIPQLTKWRTKHLCPSLKTTPQIDPILHYRSLPCAATWICCLHLPLTTQSLLSTLNRGRGTRQAPTAGALVFALNTFMLVVYIEYMIFTRFIFSTAFTSKISSTRRQTKPTHKKHIDRERARRG